jgi:proton-translocating NAD(P)+ transhydrogenase subunit alpha
MRIAVTREVADGERRVALVPKSIAAIAKLGGDVVIESGAGLPAGISDSEYTDAGATVADSAAAALKDAEIVLCVRRPAAEAVKTYPKNAVVIGMLDPGGDSSVVGAMREHAVTSFSLEALPRITRAQDMDVLSAMANLSGYSAALIAATRIPKIFPLMMTAAGTITPAHVLVIGAGVAGLQAIATCRRLGAVVEAFDVRSAAREQVESLGARFVDTGVTAEGSGGYAAALSHEDEEREKAVLAEHVAGSDVVITTAFVPNRPAPKLITKEMVTAMKPGSVIVDLAAPAGGNCELTQPDQEVPHGDVLVLGPTNLASALAPQSSQLYSHNLTRFLSLLLKEGKLEVNLEDEILQATCVTHNGEVVSERVKELLGAKP